jgi:hypothetical protein
MNQNINLLAQVSACLRSRESDMAESRLVERNRTDPI